MSSLAIGGSFNGSFAAVLTTYGCWRPALFMDLAVRVLDKSHAFAGGPENALFATDSFVEWQAVAFDANLLLDPRLVLAGGGNGRCFFGRCSLAVGGLRWRTGYRKVYRDQQAGEDGKAR